MSLGERIAETAAHLDAAMHRLLTDLREFDAKGGWFHAGARTCGEWLSWRVGWALGSAREHVRVAKALGGLPLIDEALRIGEMSYSKVRAMTRVATSENERLLLADARLVTGEQLAKICRKYALVCRHDRDKLRPSDERDRRYVRRRDLADGMVRIEANLHPDEAAIVWAALDRSVKNMYDAEFDREEPTESVPAGTLTSDSSATGEPSEPGTGVPAGTSRMDSAATGAHEAEIVPAGTSSIEGVLKRPCAENRGNGCEPTFPQTRRRPRTAFLRSPVSEAIRSVRAGMSAAGVTEPVSEVTRNVPAGTSSIDSTTSTKRPLGRTGKRRDANVPAGTSASSAKEEPKRVQFDRADGLVAMAHRFALGEHQDCSPIEVVVTVPASALRSGAANDITQVGVLPDGDCIHSETARRLSCDAGIVEMVEDEHGQPLSVARRARSIPAAIKRALIKRDRMCRFPGCTNRLWIDGHHIEHWADGGETKLDNLVLLCTRHHRFVHEYGYRVDFDDQGEPRFFDPKGRRAHDVPPRLTRDDLGYEWVLHHNKDFGITADSQQPQWDGQTVPYDEIVYYLYRADEGTLPTDSYE